ncbi:PH domain-containing protein [Anaerovibrio lipolyticus]|uniref:PH domain-containing protein n=1 Tax=Anaerovibrio lipolyticus TaxID=82374 RepID=UPI00048370F5|nr:PH domain-containing protein [Anaerovibrio lipolyticus]
MGLLDGLLGNASEVKTADAQQQYQQLLAPGEKIDKAYKVIRDMFLFTNKRLILVDIQGITGKKIEYMSIPYENITHFSIETAGHFDLDAELKIWIAGMGPTPLEKTFNSQLNIYELQRLLASYILK